MIEVGVVSSLLIKIVTMFLVVVVGWTTFVKGTSFSKHYWKAVSGLLLLTIFLSFNTGLSAPKFVLTDEAGGVVRQGDILIKDTLRDDFPDYDKRLKENQELYNANK